MSGIDCIPLRWSFLFYCAGSCVISYIARKKHAVNVTFDTRERKGGLSVSDAWVHEFEISKTIFYILIFRIMAEFVRLPVLVTHLNRKIYSFEAWMKWECVVIW